MAYSNLLIQTFDCVTILFTDVVGFTTICSAIKPMGVVDFLNDMFSAFDALTDKHGVFKVETIGDAYMVVGGAPNRTPHHVEYVLDCARSFVEATETMVERSSQQKIRIRVGIHSGAVIAGVVGLKMPRYCMFGETVGIANKMESTGQAMKIQVSQFTYDMQQEIDKRLFKFTYKGEYEVKEGERIKTYWLDDKNGRPKTPPPMAVNDDSEAEIDPEDEIDEDVNMVSVAAGVLNQERRAYSPVSETGIESFSRASSAMTGGGRHMASKMSNTSND
uniref:Guanylate cyclase domain-containing protein n=1 Tax=Plectus sambesii TaxID=2011161 RepID=A0A914UZE5_9BILA